MLSVIKYYVYKKFPIKFVCFIQSALYGGKVKIGKRSYINKSVHIIGKDKIEIGFNSCISDGSYMNVNNRSSDGKAIIIGNNCYIGKNNFFSSGKSIQIKDYVLTAIGCKFIGSTHLINNPNIPYISAGITASDVIVVGVNCFLGADVSIKGGIKIGHGSVIGSNSLVIRDIPPFSLVVGSPAVIIKRFSFKKAHWIAIEDFDAFDEDSLPTEENYLSKLKNKTGDVLMPWIASGKSLGDL